MKQKQDLRTRVKLGLERLAFGSASDAMRLLYLEDVPSAEVLAGMDLFHVAEVKRGKNGVEVKLFDRFRAMELLEKLAEAESGGEAVSPLYRAIRESLGGTRGDVGRDDI